MKLPRRLRAGATGFGIIEALVTLVILMVGLLGLVKLMLVTQVMESEAYQRTQARALLQDMVTRINANRTVARCYAFTTDTSNGLPYLGVGASTPPGCSMGALQAYTLANSDLVAWSNLLAGAAETLNGSSTGAMQGGRGCVSYDATTRVYLVSVAWQGRTQTVAPAATLNCGKGLYGNETQRRVVSVTLQIANLN